MCAVAGSKRISMVVPMTLAGVRPVADQGRGFVVKVASCCRQLGDAGGSTRSLTVL